VGEFKFRPDGKTLSFSRDHGLGLEIHGGDAMSFEGNTVMLHHFPGCHAHQCASSFVKNEDCSLSPKNAAHLVLGWGTVTRDGPTEKPAEQHFPGLTLVPTGSADRVVVEGIKYMLAQLPAYTLHCVFVHIIVLISSFRLCRSVWALLPVSNSRHEFSKVGII